MINKKLVEKNFSLASDNYQQFATIQSVSALNLLNKLLETDKSKKYQRVLDLGCGCNSVFQKTPSQNDIFKKIVNFDISNQMLCLTKKQSIYNHFVQGDMDFLPFKENKFDLIFSSFAIQWSQNLELLFKKLAKLMANNAYLAIAAPNDKSLQNLKKASIDSGCNFHFIKMPNHQEIAKNIENSGLKTIESFTSKHLERFDNPLQAIKNIKKIGANYNNLTKEFVNKKSLINFTKCAIINDGYFDNDWNISYFVGKITKN